MVVKGAMSSSLTLILGLVCLCLGGVLLARLVWTADPVTLEVNEQPGSQSYLEEEEEEEEEGEGEKDENRDHQHYSNGVFEYNSDLLVGDCIHGTCSTAGARSCQELKELGLPSGYYWIRTEKDSTVQLFCDMTRECCNSTGGWTRAVLLNMSDPTHECPEQWREITSPKRTCGRMNNEEQNTEDGSGCSSAIFKTFELEYSHVCGRVLGYQHCNTLAFWSYFHNEDDMTIDDAFVDGVTISHGSAPRQHVWTFAAALYENYKGRDTICQCTKRNYDNKSYRRVRVPPWVGTSYFCETGTITQPPNTTEQCSQVYEGVFYSKDPLWDGQGCGPNSNCCNFHGPPWFCKKLPQPTTDDIEIRICGSTYTSFGDTPVELIELYIN